MRAAARDEAMGAPLFLHCVHRNKVAPDYITSDRVIANSVLHEIDIARFLLDEEFAAVTVTAARASRHAPGRHPLLVLLETTGGTLVSVEMSPDARYGYDVRAELVCEEGTVSLAPAPPVATRRAGWDGHAVPADWRPRFAEAYRVQLHEWIAALRGGDHRGASAWDGYVATATAEAALRALGSGQRALVRLDQPPAGPGP
jgi:myo-inositol 2-dehydrogenase/D-chiro-inositol 1-dehydrogenase